MKSILCADKIHSGYANFCLNGLSLKIMDGSITGIIGPNGSGKTTLIKSLSGNLALSSGGVFFKEKNIKDYNRKEYAREVAIVSQLPAIPSIRVQDYILLGRIPYYKKFQFFETGENVRFVTQVMEYTGVISLKDRSLNELSGGEKQLCHITRALAQKPELLILDEPTNFLDISHQVKILDLLHRLKKTEKLTILIVMHDLNLASEYCDYLFMMKEGEVFVEGKPGEVLDYSNIEQVYDTAVLVKENPISAKPFIFVISHNELNKHKKKYQIKEEDSSVFIEKK
jgi:iron complex transport system ATP-binding protein